MDENAKGILAQAFGVVRGVEHNGEDRGPALGRREARVLVATLDPGDAKTVVRGPDHARNVDGDLDPSDLGERIVGAGIVIERDGTLVGDEVVGREPVLADDDGVGRDCTDILDEAREMPGDLRIGRPVLISP